MGYFLLDNPVKHGPKWYPSRRKPVRLAVMHITAGLEQMRQVSDDSAEATARYCANTDRKVSWHSGVDWDSVIDLLPPDYTAFHCQGYNSESLGMEISKRTTDWSDAPQWWVDRVLANAARKGAEWARTYGIPVRRLTLAQVQAGAGGFVDHSTLDPDRRTDPGANFPWARFLDLVTRNLNPQQEDDMVRLVRNASTKHVYQLVDAQTLKHVASKAIAAELDGPDWESRCKVLPASHDLFTNPAIKRTGPK